MLHVEQGQDFGFLYCSSFQHRRAANLLNSVSASALMEHTSKVQGLSKAKGLFPVHTKPSFRLDYSEALTSLGATVVSVCFL